MNQELKNKIKNLSERFHAEKTPAAYQELCEYTSTVLQEVSSLRKAQERTQEEILRPYKEAIKTQQESLVGPFAELIGNELLLKEMLSQLINDSAQIQSQLFELQKIAQQEGDMAKVSELAQQCAKAAITLPKGIYTRQVPDVEIEDISKIPSHFLRVNKVLLIDFLQKKGNELPGVKLTAKISIGVREEK